MYILGLGLSVATYFLILLRASGPLVSQLAAGLVCRAAVLPAAGAFNLGGCIHTHGCSAAGNSAAGCIKPAAIVVLATALVWHEAGMCD